MALATGKRKRDTTSQKPRKSAHIDESDNSGADEQERLKAVFAKHFEAQFKPLPQKKVQKQELEVVDFAAEDEEGESEDDWVGFSSEEEDAPVQVIEYNEARDEDTGSKSTSKKELNAFLSGKIPKSSWSASDLPSGGKSTTSKSTGDEEDNTEKLNLKNDLALQRLLSESHLLDASQSQNSLEAAGKNRLRALDLRMQSLGVKTSTFDGGKMPMNMRKGITTHRQGLAQKRRRDARENGIILEKEKRVKKFEGRREKGIGGPIVGKYKDGMLTLSKRDVRNIEGPKDDRRGGKGKKRRR